MMPSLPPLAPQADPEYLVPVVARLLPVWFPWAFGVGFLLLLAISIFMIVRSELRRLRAREYARLQPTEIEMQTFTVSEVVPVSVIEYRFPRITFTAETCQDIPFGQDKCAWCVYEFADGDSLTELPQCRHVFHTHCVAKLMSRIDRFGSSVSDGGLGSERIDEGPAQAVRLTALQLSTDHSTSIEENYKPSRQLPGELYRRVRTRRLVEFLGHIDDTYEGFNCGGYVAYGS
ncbi:hypothetical protein Tsubulata_022274 [Turnera subulata]|uniref:RING-type domain-containing protein n=1 Tax=Turnera subulata TaxID=218843 RepID=A0A9Q0GFI5_9ROSI|nr:hypothetical protein Tsubulata_022274 [Turnera subulata]